jgi:hypothetical protein
MPCWVVMAAVRGAEPSAERVIRHARSSVYSSLPQWGLPLARATRENSSASNFGERNEIGIGQLKPRITPHPDFGGPARLPAHCEPERCRRPEPPAVPRSVGIYADAVGDEPLAVCSLSEAQTTGLMYVSQALTDANRAVGSPLTWRSTGGASRRPRRPRWRLFSSRPEGISQSRWPRVQPPSISRSSLAAFTLSRPMFGRVCPSTNSSVSRCRC